MLMRWQHELQQALENATMASTMSHQPAQSSVRNQSAPAPPPVAVPVAASSVVPSNNNNQPSLPLPLPAPAPAVAAAAVIPARVVSRLGGSQLAANATSAKLRMEARRLLKGVFYATTGVFVFFFFFFFFFFFLLLFFVFVWGFRFHSFSVRSQGYVIGKLGLSSRRPWVRFYQR
jgi:hypothetical protein